jgi:tRNA nucleotidyltransferase (CCA-adding enzyme)
MQIYMLGGAVRDMVLGQTPHDKDYVVVGATADEMTERGFLQVGKHFPVFLHPESKEEYALARKEIKTGDKHTDFKFVFGPDVTLAEDLERRDFTCNALVYDMQKGEIKDLVGGLDDIKNRVLRHVNSEHFGEDPLRVLRMCRFAAKLDFTIAPETMALARQMTAAGMLQHLSPERIWQEFVRALETPHFVTFVTAMRECGAWQDLLPELEQLWQTPERTDFHPEGNSGAHTMLALKQAESLDSVTKFAVLMHDVGKTKTPPEMLPRHIGHDEAGIPLIKKICKRLKVPNKYTEFAIIATTQHMRFFAVPQMRHATLRDFVADLSRQFRSDTNLKQLFAVCKCDMLGRALSPSAEELADYESAVTRCQKVYDRLSPLNAQDMPNFAQLPHDASFFEHWRQYQINLISDL